ncbi:acetoacetate--CoA ligase [Methylobacterium nonmethylotrophicum]|uniref:acetoacetate--CoA ligase n=1 Tax=Methylobacterium nonmethylotrophicum TaxID=1141884 RepID=UPI001436AFD0|nr:acetoacetate--CoA ligase [Methylobacterium nonmethylotrophicum]
MPYQAKLRAIEGAAVTDRDTSFPWRNRTGASTVPGWDGACPAPPQLAEFIHFCEHRTGRTFPEYRDFEAYAVEEFRAFWSLFLRWSRLPVSGSTSPVCDGELCERARFFPDLRLNYAEALLTGRDGHGPALTACHPHRPDEELNRSELCRRVTALAGALRRLGIRPGDRVAAVARNNVEAVVAALAAAAIGAVFSSCAPDMGAHAMLSRLGPVAPRLLLAHLRPEPWDTGVPIAARVAEVAGGLSSLTHLIALDAGEPASGIGVPVLRYADLISQGDEAEFTWERFPFNHPLFIMFSSGTTGAPKCIVHGAGGTLIEHIKEHRLHCDIRPAETIYFHTSCAWMMWNWQLSALASGAELVLFDGPVQGPDTLWALVERRAVAVFGTSPAYLELCEGASFSPRAAFDFTALRAILSTGSILHDRQFDWVCEHVKAVPLQSISGGTDIIGCFVLGNPLLPVQRGEAQCRSLGLDVRALAEDSAGIGELVCASPFPSRPLGFLGDTDGSRFHASYFSQNPPLWTHGDLIAFTPAGGARLHGRSDGVLNIRGVRVGPAEIHDILRAMDEIVEAMAVEQRAEAAPGGTQLVLLVVLREGATLTPGLTKRIRSRLAADGSTAMIPARCVQVSELPTTFNGKRSEAAARDAVNGHAIRNLDALANPASTDAIRDAIRRNGAVEHERPTDVVESRANIQVEGDLERLLKDITSRRVGVPVSPDESLLEIGADSLTLLKLLMEIEEMAGCEVAFDAFLSDPSVRGLSRLIRGERGHSSTHPEERPEVRPVRDEDVEAICRLLQEGFGSGNVGPGDWRRLFERPWASSVPTTGFVLTMGSEIVGFLGTLYSQRPLDEEGACVCNLTSWYVRPGYRGQGSLLLAAATRDKSVTYTTLTPGPETTAMVEALNFLPLKMRRFFLPGLNLGTLRAGSLRFDDDPRTIRSLLSEVDQRIFDDHAAYDLLHLVVRENGEQTYLILKRRRVRAVWSVLVPGSELLYCSNPGLLVRHFERIKLAILMRQRAVVFAADEGFVPATIRAARKARGNRYRNSLAGTAPELDLLYSELVLLPI